MANMVPCPKEIIQAGVLLVATRNRATATREFANQSIEAVKAATEYMHKHHGAAIACSGEAEILLCQVAAMEGAVKQAHRSLQNEMKALNCEEPTDTQIVKMAKEMGIDLQGASWR